MEQGSTPENSNDNLLYEPTHSLELSTVVPSAERSLMNASENVDSQSIDLNSKIQTNGQNDSTSEDDYELILNDVNISLGIDELNESNERKTFFFGSKNSSFGSFVDQENTLPAVSVNANKSVNAAPTHIPKLIKTVNEASLADNPNLCQIDNSASNASKPWNQPGVDITDYFNYGFNEETWKNYCEKQKFFRSESNMLHHSNNASFHVPATSASGTASHNLNNLSTPADLFNQIVKLIPDKSALTQKLLSSALPGLFNLQHINSPPERIISVENLINAAERCKLPSEIVKAFLIMALSGVDLPPNTRVESPPADFTVPTVDSSLLYNQMIDITQQPSYQPPRNLHHRQNLPQKDSRPFYKKVHNSSYVSGKNNSDPNNNTISTVDANSSNTEQQNSHRPTTDDTRKKPSSYNRLESRKRNYTDEKRPESRERSYKDASSSRRSRRSPPTTSTSKRHTTREPYKYGSSNFRKSSRSYRRRSSSKYSSRRRRRDRSSSDSRSRSYSKTRATSSSSSSSSSSSRSRSSDSR